MILSIRTDKPDSELGLHEDYEQVAYEVWQAHRKLAETIHLKLQALLKQEGKQLSDITGIVVFQGPGSFTGLRIGLSVANALSYSLDVPVAATQDPDWIHKGIQALLDHPKTRPVLPEYGAAPNITQQRK